MTRVLRGYGTGHKVSRRRGQSPVGERTIAKDFRRLPDWVKQRIRRQRTQAPPFNRSTRPPHSSQSVASSVSRNIPNFAMVLAACR